jgi:hypothetical protein
VLNRRLPQITAREVLPIVPAGKLFRRLNYEAANWQAARVDKPNTRRNVPGSRLFNEICGQARAKTKNAASSAYDLERLPSSCTPS